MDRDPKQFQQDSGEPSEETLTAARTIDEQAAAIRERAQLLGLPWHEKPIEADPNAILLVEPETAVRLRVVPITLRDGHLVLAMFDPLDTESADEISILCGREVEREGMEPGIFAELLRQHYGTTASKMADLLGGQRTDLAALDAMRLTERGRQWLLHLQLWFHSLAHPN